MTEFGRVQQIPVEQLTDQYRWLNPKYGSAWTIKHVMVRESEGKVAVYGSCPESLGGEWNQTLPMGTLIDVEPVEEH